MKWSAGWGSACDPCAKAKTRCIRSQDKNGTKCTRECRCQSLDILCTQQVRKPRKKRLRQNASTIPDSEIPQLGQKYSHFDSTPGSHVPPFRTEDASATTSEDERNHAAESETNVYTAQVKVEAIGAFNVSTSLPGFHPFPSPPCTCLWEMDGNSDLEATESDQDLLSIYRTRLSPQFPFVIIPDDLTAIELQKSRPFLAKAIRMVASLRHRRSMWTQSRLMMRHISEAVFMGPDRSLDLLQGIIVFLGFYHYFCFAHGHFNNLTHLASSMIADMRLDRPRARPPSRNIRIRGLDPEEPKAVSNDEKRAILAVWYINSSSAVAFNKVNSPSRHFTRQMERYLQDLQDGPEFETDDVVVQLVRAQRMNEMIAQLHQSDQSVDVRPSSNVWTTSLDSLLADLNELRDFEGRHDGHRYLVCSHHNFALLQLSEPQLVDVDNFRNGEAIAALHHTPQYFQAASKSQKEAAHIALRTWFEGWLTIPVCHFFYMPMSGYLQLMNATTVLLRRARLMLLARHRLGDSYSLEKDASSSASFIFTDVNNTSNDMMLDLLERLASRFEEARIEIAAAHCFEWSNGLLDLVAWKLRERKACIEKWMKIISTEAQSNALSSAETEGNQKPGEGCEDEGNFTASQNMEETALWLDPLEALLLGGDAYDSWS